MANEQTLILVDQIEPLILEIREQKVLLESDLAILYGVTTRRLNEQVRRNKKRFPPDFRFQVTADEKAEVVANCDHLAKLKFSSRLPHAFTEYGAIMAATILNSPRAVDVSVFIVRAFVKLRRFAADHKEFAAKLTELERRVGDHDDAIRHLVTALRELMTPPAEDKPKKPFGFARYRDEP